MESSALTALVVMPMDEEQIPYEDPDLRKAYRWGWEAWFQGRLRPKRHRVHDGKSAKAWLEGYIAAEDAEVSKENGAGSDVEEAGGTIDSDTVNAKEAGGTENGEGAKNTSGEVRDLSDANPYGESEARLREAWTEGYRSGSRGDPLTKSADEVRDDAQLVRARLKGYQAALEQRRKE